MQNRYRWGVAARALLDLHLNADDVSRAYYGAFHSLRAMLLSRGVEAKTHAGAIHLFNIEFVRTGLFATSHNRLLAGIQRSRELAEYDAGVTFSNDDVKACLSDAEAFRAEVVTTLQTGGWVA